jgi:hypothetical protein
MELNQTTLLKLDQPALLKMYNTQSYETLDSLADIALIRLLVTIQAYLDSKGENITKRNEKVYLEAKRQILTILINRLQASNLPPLEGNKPLNDYEELPGLGGLTLMDSDTRTHLIGTLLRDYLDLILDGWDDQITHELDGVSEEQKQAITDYYHTQNGDEGEETKTPLTLSDLCQALIWHLELENEDNEKTSDH